MVYNSSKIAIDSNCNSNRPELGRPYISARWKHLSSFHWRLERNSPSLRGASGQSLNSRWGDATRECRWRQAWQLGYQELQSEPTLSWNFWIRKSKSRRCRFLRSTRWASSRGRTWFSSASTASRFAHRCVFQLCSGVDLLRLLRFLGPLCKFFSPVECFQRKPLSGMLKKTS